MLTFIVGFVLGTWAGFILTAIVVSASRNDEDED